MKGTRAIADFIDGHSRPQTAGWHSLQLDVIGWTIVLGKDM